MTDLVKVKYLGPDKIRVMRDSRTGEMFSFQVGQEVEVTHGLADEVMAQNWRGCVTDEECRIYQQHRYELVAPAGAKGGGK